MLKKTIIGLISLILLAVIAVFTVRNLALSYLQQPLANNSKGSYLLKVQRGDTARAIVANINRHFSRPHDEWDYRLAQLLIGVDQLQAGLYQIDAGDHWLNVWQKLAQGHEKQFQVTLIEGHRFKDWLIQLQQQPYLRSVLKQDNLQQHLPFLADYPSPEGLFLPETYSYRADSTDVAMLTNAYHAMQERLSNAWQQRDRSCPLKSRYELLTLASIVEKETGMDGERKMVASVFCNRLNHNMRLQSDPTTIYAIDNFDGNLTRQHLRQKTPYNTYRIDGLPPTPIAMVSAESLTAAANPASSNYFYFVADNRGRHVFSETLEQHNQAVYQYQIKPYQQNKE